MSFVQVLLYVAVVAAILGVPEAMRVWRLRPVVEALRGLGAQPRRQGNAVSASLRGAVVTYELRPGERRAPDLTVCSALLPAGVPGFELELRPQTPREARHIEQGRAIDVELGDAGFDDRFVVEAAPVHLARSLLDAPLRAALLRFFPCKVALAGRELRFEKMDFVRRPAEVQRLTDALLSLGARMTTIGQDVDPARGMDPPAAVGAPVGATAVQTEIAALHAARARRRAFRARRMAIAVGVGAVLGLIGYRFGCAPSTHH